jgi:hypothetical protein
MAEDALIRAQQGEVLPKSAVEVRPQWTVPTSWQGVFLEEDDRESFVSRSVIDVRLRGVWPVRLLVLCVDDRG